VKVLVVDDSRAVRALISGIIQDMGHEVIEAENGSLAVSVYSKNTIDLVLMDVEMPEMGGFEATHKIRSIGKHWVPIIFLSGHNDDKDIVAGIDAGGDAYLAKPVNATVLQAMVRAMNRISATQQALQNANRKLNQMARIDSLTRLPNRRQFDEVLDREWSLSTRKKEPFSLIIMDVDFFKKYNDTYGHAKGDECLRKVADSMHSALLRPTDTVSRYGGEEFAVILPNTDVNGATEVASRMCEFVEKMQIEHSSSDISNYVTMSAGVATRDPGGDVDRRKLFRIADENLYSAKENGRNQVCAQQEK